MSLDLDVLKQHKLVYIATVYTKHPINAEAAFIEAATFAGALANHGVKVFSPITHGHPLSEYGDVPHYDHDLWMELDKPFLEAADAMVVVTMENWRQSRGIAHEINTFAASKPIYTLNPVTYELQHYEPTREAA